MVPGYLESSLLMGVSPEASFQGRNVAARQILFGAENPTLERV